MPAEPPTASPAVSPADAVPRGAAAAVERVADPVADRVADRLAERVAERLADPEPEPGPNGTPIRPGRLIGLAALIALAVGCLLVLRPFLSALLWAAILAYSTWPAFRVLRERTGLGPGWAAGIMVAAEMVLVGVPLFVAAPTNRGEVEGLQGQVQALLTQGLPGLSDWLRRLPLVGEGLHDWYDSVDHGLGSILEAVSPYAGNIAQMALSALTFVLSGLAELLLALFLAFFFYRDGPAMAGQVQGLMQRLAGERGRELLALIGNVTQGVVYGLIGTAIAQGIMTGLGLWVAGVPRPVLLGVAAGAVSVLPVGAPVVWLPATLWLFSQGQTGWGIFLGLYGAFGISSVDNFIRPWMISRGADLPLLLTLLGALGGVFAFGFLGLFLGPVLLAVGYTLVRDWTTHPRDGDRAEAAADAQADARARATPAA